jgi:hypothetical protein
MPAWLSIGTKTDFILMIASAPNETNQPLEHHRL